MKLILSDWLIIALYFMVSAAIGLAYTRKASRSLEDYFLSGRALPWWLAGTSMVATTFAADTPLAVAGLVQSTGGRQLAVVEGTLSGVLTLLLFRLCAAPECSRWSLPNCAMAESGLR